MKLSAKEARREKRLRERLMKSDASPEAIVQGRLLERAKLRARSELGASKPAPPVFGELALRFVLSRKNRDAIIGDLQEEYAKVFARFSPGVSRFWYSWQVCREILRFSLTRLAVLSGLARAAEALRRYIGN